MCAQDKIHARQLIAQQVIERQLKTYQSCSHTCDTLFCTAVLRLQAASIHLVCS